ALRAAPDIARAVSRVILGRGSPRDLGLIRDGLATAGTIRSLLDKASDGMGLAGDLGPIAGRLASIDANLSQHLTDALIDDPPHQKKDGGFVRQGFRADLD